MHDFVKRIREKRMKKIEDGIFLVAEKHLLKAKNGDDYLGLKLKDKTGTIDAKIWNNRLYLKDKFDESDFVKVTGESNLFKDNWQIIVKNIEKIDDKNISKEDFLPSTSRDINAMKEEMFGIINGVKNQSLKKLLLNIFKDEDFLNKFCKAPAAKTMHHAYVGGLLEHTLSVTKLSKQISQFYGGMDEDMLVSCALLHDIGKVEELDSTTFGYTTSGKMIGHVTISYTIVQNKIEEIKALSEDKVMRLLHCILSHHGEYEYGSPKRPKTKEAVLFNLVDVLDSRMQPVISAGKDTSSDAQWSEMVGIIGRNLYIENKKNVLFE